MFLNLKTQGFFQMMKGGEKVPEAQYCYVIQRLTSDIFHPGAFHINAIPSTVRLSWFYIAGFSKRLYFVLGV